jgi:hypothetical protein
MTTHENSRSRPGGAESHLNGKSLVNKLCVLDPKMIFVKNQEVEFLVLKCKTTPVLTKSARACAKFKIYLWRLLQRNETSYAYPRCYTIYVGWFSQLSILHFGSRFSKNWFWHSENGKGTFRATKWILASMAFLSIPRVRRVSDMASFRQTMPWSWPNLAHFT